MMADGLVIHINLADLSSTAEDDQYDDASLIPFFAHPRHSSAPAARKTKLQYVLSYNTYGLGLVARKCRSHAAS